MGNGFPSRGGAHRARHLRPLKTSGLLKIMKKIKSRSAQRLHRSTDCTPCTLQRRSPILLVAEAVAADSPSPSKEIASANKLTISQTNFIYPMIKTTMYCIVLVE